MLPALNQYCKSLVNDFSSISDERKFFLEKISNYISEKSASGTIANLIISAHIIRGEVSLGKFGQKLQLTFIIYEMYSLFRAEQK